MDLLQPISPEQESLLNNHQANIDIPIEPIQTASDYYKLTFGNIILLLYSVLKICCCFFVYLQEERVCSEPLDIWLLFVIFDEALLVIYLFVCLFINHWLYKQKQSRMFLGTVENFAFGNSFFTLEDVSFFSSSFEGNDLINFLNNLDNYNFHFRLNHEAEKTFVFLTYIRHLSHYLYLLLFLWGCFLLTMKHSNCAIICPKMYSFTIILLLLSVVYIFLPLFILFCVCFCVPCLLISSFFCGAKTRNCLEKDLLKKLERKGYNSKEFTEHEECIICRQVFIKNDKIIILPCSRKHYFHEKCVEKWLEINCLCPICRADLNSHFKNEHVTQEKLNLTEIILALNNEN